MIPKDNLKAAFDKEIQNWDPEELWPNIENSLPKKRDRKIPLWIMYIMLALGLIVYTVSAYQKYNKKESDQIVICPLKKNGSIDNISKSKSKTQSQKSTYEPEIKSTLGIVPNSMMGKFIFGKSTTSTLNSKSFIEKAKYPKISTQKDEQNRTDTSKDLIYDSLIVNSETSRLGDNINKEFPSNTEMVYIEKIETLVPRLNLQNNSSLQLTRNKQILNKIGNNSKWVISLATGAYFNSRTFVANTTQNLKYVSYKIAHERILASTNTNLQINYQYSNYRFGIGLQWDRFTEVFEGQDITITKVPIVSDSAYVVNHNGIKEYYSGPINQIHTKGKNIISPNILTRWSFPVEFGYVIDRFGKLKLYPHFGVCLNFYSQYAGITIDENLNFIYKDDDKIQRIYRSSGVHSFYTGLNGEMDIYRNIAFFIGMRYQKDLSNIQNLDLGTDYKYKILGMNVGFRCFW